MKEIRPACDPNGVYSVKRTCAELGISNKTLKIVNGENGLFVSMPNYSKDGEYKDICYPTTASFRNKISNAVIEKYQEVSKNKEQNRSQNEPENDRPRHKSI
jgi:DNA-binding cell septation regulator SpoVG